MKNGMRYMRTEYCAYLRKSRADAEAEAHGAGETLARHEHLLMETARRLNITITAFYREVVSGDSIAARPEMQRLLQDVEAGKWAGVLCVEITRLARGDTIDQGLVAQTFKYANTKIITPVKIYDPSNEFDEEYFEFSLFMSRREYKMINQRQQRGRIASINEGKWVAHKTPYGYRRVKLSGEKGWTLEPDENAPVVRDIFRWFVGEDCEPIGVSLIVRRLNERGIPSATGQDWTNPTVRDMLRNVAYCGKIKWGWRANEKTYKDGALTVSRPRNSEPLIVPGRHPALVSQEIFDRAQEKLARNPSRPGPKQMEMKNPLSGLVRCSKCGRGMVRRPYGDNRPDGLICPYTSCNTVSSNLDDVEAGLLDALRVWLANLERRPDEAEPDAEIPSLRRTISTSEAELKKLSAQLDRAYELVEQGVYTPEIFLERSQKISARRDELLQAITTLTDEITRREQLQASQDALAPSIRHVIEAYPLATTPKEKNALLKSVLEKVVYTKEKRDRWGGDGFHLDLYPLMPKL